MSTTQKPNVLWICTDQQRWDTIHALGNKAIRTPNLDRLCAEGTAFTHAHCQSPICTPSRASFLTGLYPSSVHGNINGNRTFNIPERAKMITRHLADHGWTCGLVGKLHVASAWDGEERRVDDGYEEMHFSHSPQQLADESNEYFAWLKSSGKLDEVLDFSANRPAVRTGVKYQSNVPFELHQTTWCADVAIDFMNRHSGSPWLMSVNIFDPHGPMDAPEEFSRPYEEAGVPEPLYRESDVENQHRLSTHVFQGPCNKPGELEQREKASYYGMIELIDRNVGRMLDELERSGQRENTIVIFTSDHGDMLGDHGLRAKGCRLYDGLVRVPLIVSSPGRVEQGLVSDALVELTDIAPTLAELAGVPLEWTQGESLWPILRGDAPPDNHRDFVRTEFYDVLDMTWGRDVPAPAPSYATMYRDKRYKLNVFHGNEYGELYDMQNDPNEFVNLWEDPEYAELKCRLMKLSFDASIVITDPGSVRIGRF